MGQGILWVEATASSRPGSVLAAFRAAPAAVRVGVARAILRRRRGTRRAPAAPWIAAMLAAPAVRMVWGGIGERRLPSGGGRGRDRFTAGRRGPAQRPAGSHLLHRGLRGPRSSSRLLPRREATVEVEGAESSRRSRRPSASCAGSADAGVRPGRLRARLRGRGDLGDLAGFCAATYQQGIPLVEAPTTLVARVDSAWGKMRWICRAKNYVGVYHLPTTVPQIRPPSRPCRGTGSRRASWRW